MEIPKNKDNRVGDLPVELKDMLKSYRVTPDIVITADSYNTGEIPSYNIAIIYADGSHNVISLDFDEEIIEDFLSITDGSKFIWKKIGYKEEDGHIYGIELNSCNNGGCIDQPKGCCMSISLSKEAFSILISKIRIMFSDYLKCKEDPNKYKMKEKY